MRRILKVDKKYLELFFVLIFLLLLSACNGITPTLPVINSFTANPSSIDSGDSSVLSWNVTNATTITIIPGYMNFTSYSGSVDVSPTMNTNYTLTATNAEGSVSYSVPVTVNPVAFIEHTITIQPGPEEGKDSFINTDCPDCMVGDAESLYLGYRYSAKSLIYRVYLQFNLSMIPVGAVIDSALLKIYQYDYYSHDDPQDFTIGVHRLNDSWQEDTIIWDIQCNYEDTSENTCPVTPDEVTWLSWDIADLVQGWLDGDFPNYGMVLKSTNETVGNSHIYCYSSDYTDDSTLCPKLEITYQAPVTLFYF